MLEHGDGTSDGNDMRILLFIGIMLLFSWSASADMNIGVSQTGGMNIGVSQKDPSGAPSTANNTVPRQSIGQGIGVGIGSGI